jgi:hypothetical protein
MKQLIKFFGYLGKNSIGILRSGSTFKQLGKFEGSLRIRLVYHHSFVSDATGSVFSIALALRSRMSIIVALHGRANG